MLTAGIAIAVIAGAAPAFVTGHRSWHFAHLCPLRCSLFGCLMAAVGAAATASYIALLEGFFFRHGLVAQEQVNLTGSITAFGCAFLLWRDRPWTILDRPQRRADPATRCVRRYRRMRSLWAGLEPARTSAFDHFHQPAVRACAGREDAEPHASELLARPRDPGSARGPRRQAQGNAARRQSLTSDRRNVAVTRLCCRPSFQEDFRLSSEGGALVQSSHCAAFLECIALFLGRHPARWRTVSWYARDVARRSQGRACGLVDTGRGDVGGVEPRRSACCCNGTCSSLSSQLCAALANSGDVDGSHRGRNHGYLFGADRSSGLAVIP